MEEKRFTYVVNPRRPIRGIQDMPPIKSSRTLKLTKEEALLAMKCGPVYRKFANEGIQERVMTSNIDRLHQEKFITEKEYSGSNIPVVAEGEGTIAKEEEKPVVEQITPVETEKDAEPIPEVQEVEQPAEEDPVEEVTIESTPNVEEADAKVDTDEPIVNQEVSTSEESKEEISDPVVEDSDVEDNEEVKKQNNSQVTVDYNGNRRKKKKRRN